MTKADIVRRIAQGTGLTKTDTSAVVDGFIQAVIDALEDGAIVEKEVVELEEEALPEPMKGLSSNEKLDYVREKSAEREKIQREISQLSEARSSFVAEKKRQQVAGEANIGDALSNAVKKEAMRKNFELSL